MKTPIPGAPTILVVDDEENIRFVLRQVFKAEGFAVEEATDGVDAVEKVRKRHYPIVIMDVRMPKMDGLAALRQIREIDPDATVLIITAHGTAKTAMEALALGAYDYFTKPFELNEVRIVVRRAVEKFRLLRQIQEMRESLSPAQRFDRLIGQSAGMQEVYSLLRRVIDNDVTVLITGESGTGKELVASAVHNAGQRAGGPFIKVNTAAIPETLLESELFGHERGAFTGAVQQKIGKVEAANGGTLFLDEIGDMPLSLQSKLLRVLQEREIERVGSTKVHKVDIRVVCATNRDLQAMVEQGTFREDLYYRINVLPIHLPPLRRRRDDIPPLIDHFIQKFNVLLKRRITSVRNDALQALLAYSWPGNVRELENVIQRAMLMAEGSQLELEHLPPTVQGGPKDLPPSTDVPGERHAALGNLDLKSLLDPNDFAIPLHDRLARISDNIEVYLIKAALRRTGGHRQESANLLGISRKSLHNKMVRYGLFGEEDAEEDR
jgi:nitrogen regulation protein NR(I)